jgi:hypothetical protein
MYNALCATYEDPLIFEPFDSCEIVITAQLDDLLQGFSNREWVNGIFISVIPSHACFHDISTYFEVLISFGKAKTIRYILP